MEISYRHDLPSKEAIYAFYDAMDWNSYLKLTPGQLHKAMQQSYASVYAYKNTQLVGTGRVVSDGVINAYLCGIGVLPDFRRQGIGAEITKRLTAHCKAHSLHVQILCEEHLIPYYEKLGFKKFATGMKS